MNILFYRYGSICEPDIIDGFRELGNTVTEMKLEMTAKNLPFPELVKVLHQKLLTQTFDFVFSINFYPFISEVCNIHGLLYLSWTVDCPVMELMSSSIQNMCNRIFLFDKAQYDDVHPLNPECTFYLPLATNPKRWNSIIASASTSDIVKYSCDVSFVGSLYTEKCPYDQLTGASDYLTGYLNGIMDAQQKVYGAYFLEELLPPHVVEEFSSHMPNFYIPAATSIRNDVITIARMYLCPKIAVKERFRTMMLLGNRFSVDLYTGSETTGLPVHNRGFAKTHTEMPLIFHFSKINLNITTKAIRSGLPLRVFDILGCGGFLLTNYQSELPAYFTPGVDLECYSSEDDMLSKTEYYLTHEKDRVEITQNGYHAVQKYHNYPLRLLEMLEQAFNCSNT